MDISQTDPDSGLYTPNLYSSLLHLLNICDLFLFKRVCGCDGYIAILLLHLFLFRITPNPSHSALPASHYLKCCFTLIFACSYYFMINGRNASTGCQGHGRISYEKNNSRGRTILPQRLHKHLSETRQGLPRAKRAGSPVGPGVSGDGECDEGRNGSPSSHFHQ